MSCALVSGADTSAAFRCAENYEWMLPLPRTSWAWEWLRRNPDYHASWVRWQELGARGATVGAVDGRWPLVRLEDPGLDARTASVFWRRDACREVLPLAATTAFGKGEPRFFQLDHVRCHVVLHPEPDLDRLNVVFAEEGRFFQLLICGAAQLDTGTLLTPILPAPHLRAGRLQAIRRFNDLMATGTLRPSLYPAEHRNARLLRVVQALDGALAGVPHRDIAVALFGEARVAEEWHGSANYLRDYVRRAIAHGRELVQGGYMRFLR